MGKQEKEEDLIEQARRELKKCEGDWTRLSKLTGRKLSYRWIVSFANGEVKDPGARRLLLLCKYIGLRVMVQEGPHFMKFQPE